MIKLIETFCQEMFAWEYPIILIKQKLRSSFNYHKMVSFIHHNQGHIWGGLFDSHDRPHCNIGTPH